MTSDVRTQLHGGLAAAYTLERELGQGGMATVYVTHDLTHGRDVAVKAPVQNFVTELAKLLP